MKLRNAKIGVRLGLGFGSLLLIFVVATIVSISILRNVEISSKQIAEESVPFAIVAEEMSRNVSQVWQFLTDVSATHEKEGYKDAEEETIKFREGLAKFRVMFKSENNTKALTELEGLEDAFNRFYDGGKIMAETYITQGIEAGNKAMEDFDKAGDMLIGNMERLRKEQIEEVSTNSHAIVSALGNIQRVMLIAGAIALVLGFLIAFFITRGITTPLYEAVKISNALAKGDMTVQVSAHSTDETGELMIAMKAMSESLKNLIGSIGQASNQIASSSEELSTTAEQMSKGAQTQTSQTSQIATAMEEMSSTVLEVAKNSQSAAASANAASSLAQKGGEVVARTIGGMQMIANTVQESAKTVRELGKNSDQIGEIVAVIDDIADQTNLLALNAAIEAARAGEQGRGFAVVADEVRKLAERTTKATKEIAAMIKNIQKDTVGAVAAMEAGTREVGEGVNLANQAGESLMQIVNSVQTVNDMIRQIATASEQQSAAAEQISKSIEEIASVTKDTAAGTHQTASASHELSRMATELQGMVGQFKI